MDENKEAKKSLWNECREAWLERATDFSPKNGRDLSTTTPQTGQVTREMPRLDKFVTYKTMQDLQSEKEARENRASNMRMREGT
jgi:hypothetical protein